MSYTRLLYHIVFKTKKEHPENVSFEEEYREFLIDNGVEIDDRYFLKD